MSEYSNQPNRHPTPACSLGLLVAIQGEAHVRQKIMKNPTIWLFAALPAVIIAIGVTGKETLLVSLLGVLAVIIIGPLYVRWLCRRDSRRLALVAGCILLASAIANVTLELSSFPLKLGYHLSKGQMDKTAARLRAGETISTPRWVGLIRVKRAELSWRGVPCLWTRPHPSGSAGFVQTPPDNIPFNLWSHTKIDDEWQFISED